MKGQNPRRPGPPRISLRVLPLHLPRSWRGPHSGWELERGFRVRVLSEEALVVTLGPPRTGSGELPPGDPLSLQPRPGEESLLVLPAPRGPAPASLEAALSIPEGEGWRPSAALLLSDRSQLRGGLATAWGRLAAAARGSGTPCAWVLQDMPAPLFRGVPYFTVERSLQHLGRIGRRLRRQALARRLLPW